LEPSHRLVPIRNRLGYQLFPRTHAFQQEGSLARLGITAAVDRWLTGTTGGIGLPQSDGITTADLATLHHRGENPNVCPVVLGCLYAGECNYFHLAWGIIRWENRGPSPANAGRLESRMSLSQRP
jgi:hypothetical protein